MAFREGQKFAVIETDRRKITIRVQGDRIQAGKVGQDLVVNQRPSSLLGKRKGVGVMRRAPGVCSASTTCRPSRAILLPDTMGKATHRRRWRIGTWAPEGGRGDALYKCYPQNILWRNGFSCVRHRSSRSLKQTAARAPFAFNPTECKPEKSVKRWSWPAAPISSGWRTRSRPCTLEKAKKNAYWTRCCWPRRGGSHEAGHSEPDRQALPEHSDRARRLR